MTAAQETTPQVTTALNRRSHTEIFLDLPNGAPDTRGPGAEGITVRPLYALVCAWPDDQTWQCSYVMLVGPKVTPVGRRVAVTKRSYDVMFTNPLGEDEEYAPAPQWLLPLITEALDRLNGAPARVQGVVDGAVGIYRVRDELVNDPKAHALLMHYNGVVHGLRVALCALMGWDVEQESDKEGAADELILGRWKELHPEEWTA